MLKKIITTSLLATALFMSGCGSTSDAESRLQVQDMLDKQDYNGVINALEGKADTSEEYVSLAFAYMGRAGLSLLDIVDAMSNSNDNSSVNSSGFASFTKVISSKGKATALQDLSTSIAYYKKVVGSKCATGNVSLSSAEKDICLYVGLASTSSAAVTIDLISGSLDNFGGSGSDEKLTASTCAMQKASSTTVTGCTVTSTGNITFISGKTYEGLTVTVDTDTDSPQTPYYYLSNSSTTVLTQGYCMPSDFSTRRETKSAGYEACPLDETGTNELTTTGVLVNVLNDGLGSVATAGGANTQEDVDGFKCEILRGTYSNNQCSKDISSPVLESDIIAYLNSQN